MKYCEEDGLHVIKLMGKVYLRETRVNLLLVRKWQLFSGVFLCAVDDSGKF